MLCCSLVSSSVSMSGMYPHGCSSQLLSPPLSVHCPGMSVFGDSATCTLDEFASFCKFTSREVTDFTCSRCRSVVFPSFKVMVLLDYPHKCWLASTSGTPCYSHLCPWYLKATRPRLVWVKFKQHWYATDWTYGTICNNNRLSSWNYSVLPSWCNSRQFLCRFRLYELNKGLHLFLLNTS